MFEQAERLSASPSGFCPATN